MDISKETNVWKSRSGNTQDLVGHKSEGTIYICNSFQAAFQNLVDSRYYGFQFLLNMTIGGEWYEL